MRTACAGVGAGKSFVDREAGHKLAFVDSRQDARAARMLDEPVEYPRWHQPFRGGDEGVGGDVDLPLRHRSALAEREKKAPIAHRPELGIERACIEPSRDGIHAA